MRPPMPDVSLDATTEVRWFFNGSLPLAVQGWFTSDGTALLDRRSDRYLLDGKADSGVKQRSGRILELKLRSRAPERFAVAGGVCGHVESWKRWSPADGLLSLDDTTAWIDIDKAVLKRRFGIDGREQPLSAATRAMTGDGCDAEVAALTINGQPAWTCALAAFGQPQKHHDLLRIAWKTLVAVQDRPSQLQLDVETSFGYPQWITRTSYTTLTAVTSVR